jgi:hypothetical protein
MVALTFAFAGALASPASAQAITFTGPCQVVQAGQVPVQGQDEQCSFIVDAVGDTECTVTVGDDTFQTVFQCATIQQGECPGQIIADDLTIIQFICGVQATATATATATQTATPVTPGVTPTTPGVTPTVDVPPMATPVIPGVTPTATPTDVVPPDDDDDVTPPDDDDDVTPPDDEEDAPPADDADEVVEALPDTGQGPSDTNQSGILVALLGAMSALMAGAAFLFQRRTQA